MTSIAYTLIPGSLDIAAISRCAERDLDVELAEATWRLIAESAAAVTRILARGEPVYGINTGFGKLAQTRVSDDHLAELQLNLVRSHCTGVGPALSAKIVRLALLLKIASLGRGVSGVRREVVTALLALLNADVLPVLPALGSVGASGDLAPLAHLAAVLIGEGQARHGEHLMRGNEAMALIGLAPLVLGPKEGLALLNGTQVSTAIALVAEIRARRVFDSALVAGALSTDAAQGSDVPFDDRIHAVRGQAGQRAVAQRFRKLLEGSAIRASHLTCDKVQDPYCLRCQPQVMGACLDQLDHARTVLLAEANGVSDNPLIFAATDEALSGGNFHGEPVALAADNIALAVSEIGALSERRIAMLMDASLSGLPAFLACEGGLNSGFMIAQVTAAALASENKALAHPRSVDSLPTSANQEDHVSMATGAALRLLTMVEHSARIVAIELLAAAQGIDLRRPLRSSLALEAAVAVVRRASAFLSRDRALSGEIETLADVLERGDFVALSLP